MHIRIVTGSDELFAHEAAWRALALRARQPEPVLDPDWMRAWWSLFGRADGRELRAVVFEERDRWVGLAPLAARTVLHRGAIPVRTLELLCTGEREQDEVLSEYVGVLAERGREADVAEALARHIDADALGPWDEIVLDRMNDEDPAAGALAGALARRGAEVELEAVSECHYAKLPATYDAYLAALGSSKRYVVTRALRDLDKWAGKGKARLVRASTDAELAEGRRILHALHADRWGGGAFAAERFARFHDEVMPAFFARGALDLMWLEAGGEPISVVYNIVYGGKVHFYQSGRKLDVPKGVKPGIAVHALAIQRAIAAGLREYDFLGGASQYKRQLSTGSRRLVRLRAVAPGIRARAVDLARAVTERAAAELKRVLRKPAAPAEAGAEAAAEGG